MGIADDALEVRAQGWHMRMERPARPDARSPSATRLVNRLEEARADAGATPEHRPLVDVLHRPASGV